MLFNSLQFLFFFPAVTLGYFALPKFRWIWLLAASCYFYMAFVPFYIVWLAALIVVDYLAGILIEGATRRDTRKLFLAVSIVVNLAFLGVFKYANFLVGNLFAAWSFFGAATPAPWLDIILPIGLSFHTFQSMAYTIEVFRGNQRAERHFGIYALYVLFYPQLVAGPIERPQHMIHQLKEHHAFRYDRFVDGLKLMAWGMCLKVVFADRLAGVVDPVFNRPTEYHGLALLAASVAFTCQIFLDFAGYSYIAIGAARTMGIELMTNFNAPFSAKSIAEFWRRWHISLSTWFRDYVYIPLGGNRLGTLRHYANLMIVFLVSGLWHGASWNFVLWGGIHGVYLVAALACAPFLPVSPGGSNPGLRLYRVVKVFALVCLAFVFFRATSFQDAVYIIGHIPVGLVDDIRALAVAPHDMAAPLADGGLGVVLAGLGVIWLDHFILRRYGGRGWLAGEPWWLRWPVYFTVVYGTFLLALPSTGQFIYFQF